MRRNAAAKPDLDVSADRLSRLSTRALGARYAELHAAVFACYEDEPSKHDPAARRAAAEQRAAPMIEAARVVHAELVRRLRRRARIWWGVTVSISLIGVAVIAWVLLAAR
ncbi:hypothetical protein ACQQ2N_08930 [Dokdonella sp. MW10]|uniref:hypothetical protein n=1 Tax=Dokdonella sp. MW10 TaxID=2992926 RepID=UPI003F7F2EAB